jgi:hypothetical protein
MINNNQKPIDSYHEYVDYKDQELEVRGEIFEQPIVKTENFEGRVRITIFNDMGEHWGRGRINVQDADRLKLIEIVKAIKANIANYEEHNPNKNES